MAPPDISVFSFTDLLFIRLLSFDSVCGQITSQQEVAPDRKVGDVKVRRGSRCGVKAMSVIHNQCSMCPRVQSPVKQVMSLSRVDAVFSMI